MKLWLLRPVGMSGPGPSGNVAPPKGWSQDYRDAYAGLVIRAETEASARATAQRIALAAGSSEAMRRWYGRNEAEPRTEERAAWIDPALSTCIELKPDGPAGVVIVDYVPGGE